MDHDDDRLRRHLATMPEPPLPDALWARVSGARRRQLARRRLALGGGVAVAVAVLVLPFRLPQPAGPALVAHDIAATNGVQAREPAASDRRAQLRTLDRELQAAYRRGSDDPGIAQLWAARDALLREHDQPTPVRPVRI